MDSEIKMTMEQARKQMEIFRQLFHEVRLLNASDLGVEAGDSGEPNIWKTSCECRSCLGQKSFEEASGFRLLTNPCNHIWGYMKFN